MENQNAAESSNVVPLGQEQSGNRPIVSFFGSGGINVAIWKQKAENDREYFSVKLERRYKDDQGNFKSTPYLGEDDLLRSAVLLNQADQWIEQERSKQRQANAARSR